MTTPMTWPGCGAKFVRDNSAEDKTMTEQEQIRVLRDALEDVTAVLDAFGNLSDGMMHPQPWNKHGAEEKIKASRKALAATATIQPVAAPEPTQQAHVLPPFAAPAGQHDADERAFDTLHGAVMNLPCKPGQAIAMHGASKQAYQEGHRDARHAAADLISVAASGFREARNTSPESNLAAPAQAAPDEVRENLALVIARLEQIKHIAEDNFDVRTFAQEALVCANALRTTTAAQAATPADSQKGEGDASN